MRRFVFKSLSYLYVSEKNDFLLHKYPYTSEGYATAVLPTFVFRLWAACAVLVLSGQWRKAVHNSAGDRTRKMNFKICKDQYGKRKSIDTARKSTFK